MCTRQDECCCAQCASTGDARRRRCCSLRSAQLCCTDPGINELVTTNDRGKAGFREVSQKQMPRNCAKGAAARSQSYPPRLTPVDWRQRDLARPRSSVVTVALTYMETRGLRTIAISSSHGFTGHDRLSTPRHLRAQPLIVIVSCNSYETVQGTLSFVFHSVRPPSLPGPHGVQRGQKRDSQRPLQRSPYVLLQARRPTSTMQRLHAPAPTAAPIAAEGSCLHDQMSLVREGTARCNDVNALPS
jgi:hypothetical protein